MRLTKGISFTVFLTLLAYLLVMIGLGIIVYLVSRTEVIMTFISGGMVQTIPFMIISWLMWRWFGRNKWSLGFIRENWFKDLLHGLLIGFSLITIATAVISIGSSEVTVSGYAIHKDVLLAVFNVFLLFILVGLSEELFARGFIQGAARYYVGKWFAIVFSALSFSLLHMGNDHFTFELPFINLCIAGVMFALFREWKEGIWLPVGLHITWNFFQGPVYGFQVSGIQLPSLLLIEQTDQGSSVFTGGAFGPEGSIIITGLLLVTCAYVLAQINRKNSNKNT